ncbi:hypothetical protein AJ80_07785 [Polytolypa hystricis UAMH7299]|uniref:BRCT domain-containing protein n=1 Tax=Polytolypa hystricis (strain UAMH7299) TaxID=1447883 RepID=A0A2B7XJE1_POLH7|nr:hypothetical protein AJ80_07785 [Polytolypa hystricis UAMH7299]
MARVTTAPVPEDPPKRVTRARTRTTTTTTKAVAAVADDEAPAPKARGRPPKTKIAATTTAASKPATTKSRTAAARTTEPKPAAAKRGRPRAVKPVDNAADTMGADSSEDEMDVVTLKTKPKTSRATAAKTTTTTTTRSKTGTAVRGKKPAAAKEEVEVDTSGYGDDDDDDDELAQPEMPKQRTARSKAAASTAAKKGKAAAPDTAAKAPARRSRKAVAEEPAKGTTKTIHISAASLAASSAISKPQASSTAAPRKKVTFLDITSDADKENHPILSSSDAGPKHKIQMGLKAKPVRKTTATAAAAQGKKTTSGVKEEKKKEPLSPKKATQVAKSISSASSDDAGEEDELSISRSPLMNMNRSPTKLSGSSSSLVDSPVKRIDFLGGSRSPTRITRSLSAHENSEQSKPVALSESVIMASPARKLPPTPYRESIRETPRRAPILLPVITSTKETVDPAQNSPLKASPKKANFTASLPQSPFKSSLSPTRLNRSLFQSPAKRPISPVKYRASIRNETEFQSKMSDLDVEMEEDHTFQFKRVSLNERPGEIAWPPPVVEENPLSSVEETDDVFNEDPLDFDNSILEIGGNLPVAPLPLKTEELEDELAEATPISTHEDENDDPFITAETNSIPSSPVPSYETEDRQPHIALSMVEDISPAAPSPPVTVNPAQFAYRDEADDEGSDDDLMDCSPVKSKPASSRRITLGLQGLPQVEEDSLGFTPLAAKLGGWNAGSPEKPRATRSRTKELFSPVVQSQPLDPDPLERRHSRVTRQSLASRTSLAPSLAPAEPAFFEEEMAIRHRPSIGAVSSVACDDDDADEVDIHQEQEEDDLMDLGTPDTPSPATQDADDLTEEEEEDELYGDENQAPAEPTVTINAEMFEEEPAEPTVTINSQMFEEEPAEPMVTINSQMFEEEPAEPTTTIHTQMFEEETTNTETKPEQLTPRLPMSVTPVRLGSQYPRTIHTISKVPLRPEGEDSPLKIPKKRSRSLSSGRRVSTPSAPRTKLLPSSSSRKRKSPTKLFDTTEETETDTTSGVLDPSPMRYNTGTWPQATRSPSKSPTKSRPAPVQVLRGAVVFTDVHTAEGADASGIFVELLNQMGARCVKSWSWNPRASLSPVDGADPKEGKVGITHVVFKDGGVRTLEKVREAHGLVKCVGVGWVLDCERASKWLDETEYAVDTNLVPRGGAKRRKSMEPRALSNKNGTLVKLDSSTSSASGRRAAADADTVQQFLRLSPTPSSSTSSSSRRESEEDSNHTSSEQEEQISFAIQTTPTSNRRQSGVFSPVTSAPTTPDFNYSFDFDAATGAGAGAAPSPMTPYYLSQPAMLVQQTCPPKQSRQGLFSANGRDESEISEGLRIRLDAARRRSLIWKPKIGSPLRH